MTQNALITVGLVFAIGCGGNSPQANTGGPESAGNGGATTSTSGASSGGGANGNGGAGSGGKSTSGAAGMASGGNGTTPRPPAKGTVGVWEDVTSNEMDPELFSGDSAFGVGNIVVDPARPTDLYVGGYGSIWKSTDYGLTWQKLASKPNPEDLPLGHVLAVAGTTPATLWMATGIGEEHVYRSTDGGATFKRTGLIPEDPDAASLYSIVVDPGNSDHLITGLHEADKIFESTDAGDTWHSVSGSGFPSGGKSWFPFFVDTGDVAKTSQTWFAIAQDGGSAVMTEDGGKTWKQPKGLEGLQHPHGGSQLYQQGNTLFVAGIYGPGTGVYRSQDLGKNWLRVSDGSGAIVWGSAKNVYAMWGWACGGCTDGADYRTAAQPGDPDTWKEGTVPDNLNWGPNSVATTSDGTHTIFVGSMWATGLWRYVEP